MTIALIVINLILFLAAVSSPSLTFNSYEIPVLVRDDGQWWRLFASFFVTNNVADVGLNMISLYIIGRLVEVPLGKWRFLAIYLLSGFGGSVATYLFGNSVELSAGASGAIFGLFGAYFIIARRAALNTSGIISLIAINLVFSFTFPNINWLAHVGGLATGLVLTSGIGLGRRRRGRQEVVVDTLVICATAVILGLLMLLPPGLTSLG